jgi:NAD(P)-dependent dehydrogenase (short-subunit alcohol dehydrogenase family)
MKLMKARARRLHRQHQLHLRHARHRLDGWLLGGQGGGHQLLARGGGRRRAAAGIRVNVVMPAVVETPATAGMLADEKAAQGHREAHPDGPRGPAEELANAILFLASDEASYITGAALPVDGGRSAVLVTAL